MSKKNSREFLIEVDEIMGDFNYLRGIKDVDI